jgi:hypothetical protein
LSLDLAVCLLKAALPRPTLTVEVALALVGYHQRRNETAKQSHAKRWQERNPGIESGPPLDTLSVSLLC